jgi:Flp pilus assembly secretin CpaC
MEQSMRIHVGRRRLALAIVATIGLAGSATAANEPIDVTIDFAKIVKLPGPAHTIIVGNPGIADASVDDEQTLVLTGKTAGTTNLIVLDAEGSEVVNSVVRVSSDIRQLTTIFYGVTRQTFSCAPVCEQVISVGDDRERFETATSQIQVRRDFSSGK